MDLTEEQNKALKVFFSPKPQNAVMVITGGPGTGKTTLIEHLDSPIMKMKHLVVTKTWCAAQHIRSATGRETHVIDKIDFSAELIDRYQNCVLIIDEASMTSVDDIAPLITSLKPIKLVVVGDERQLTCNSGCPFLSTMIAASKENGGIIPVIRLTKNLRQEGAANALMNNISRIGTEEWTGPETDDSFVIRRFRTQEDAIAAAAKDFSAECQMIAFTNKVVDALNDATEHKGVDRVICTRNVEDRKNGGVKVANGIMGMRSADKVVYKNKYVDRLQSGDYFLSAPAPARCLTTHKLQGSEFSETGQLVITWFKGGIPTELIYTAMSRFKRKVIVYGEGRVLDAAFASRFSPPKINEEVVTMIKDMGSLI